MKTDYEIQAEKFLTKTKTKLSIKFKEFGSMPWDKSGEERNIFTCTLSNKNGSYTFDFGSSLKDSLNEVSMIESDEQKELYCGIKTTQWLFGTKLTVKYSDLRQIKEGKMLINQLYNQERLIKEIDTFIESEINRNRNVKYNYQKIELKNSLGRGLNIGVVEQAIKKRVLKAIEEAETEKTLYEQNEKIIKPSAYDILACITKCNPYSFENFCDEYGYDNDSIIALNTYEAVQNEWDNIESLFKESEIEELQEIQ